MQLIFRMAVVVLGLLAAMNLFAVEIPDYTTVKIPVSDQSSQTLQKVLPQALGDVLVKVSGNSKITAAPGMQTILSNANALLQSFSYIQPDPTQPQSSLLAQITFDQNGVAELLQNAHQNVWISNRPLLLVWLQVPGASADSMSNVVTSTDQNAITDTLKTNTTRRGIPYLLPMVDLQDETTMGQSIDVNALITEQKRYEANVVLSGKIILAPVSAAQSTSPQNVSAPNNNPAQNMQNYQVQWTLLLNNQPVQWDDSGKQLTDLVASGVDQAADLMANQAQKVIVNNNGGTTSAGAIVQVVVMGINDLNDYVTVVKNLQQLPSVSEVSVNDSGGSQITLSVTIQGSKNDLMNSLSNDPSFAVVPASAIDQNNTANSSLYLRWQNPPTATPQVASP